MLTSSRYYVALFAVLLAVGAVLVGGSLTPRTVSADHMTTTSSATRTTTSSTTTATTTITTSAMTITTTMMMTTTIYDCDDIFGGHNDDYAGFLSMVASPSAINCGSTTHITVDIGSYYGNHHHDDDDYNHGHGYHYYGEDRRAGGQCARDYRPGNAADDGERPGGVLVHGARDLQGPVYLSASTEFLTSSLILQVNCNITQPSAPPISAAGPGTIQPPRTGDGGLVESNTSGLPVAFAAAALAGLGFLFVSRRVISKR